MRWWAYCMHRSIDSLMNRARFPHESSIERPCHAPTAKMRAGRIALARCIACGFRIFSCGGLWYSHLPCRGATNIFLHTNPYLPVLTRLTAAAVKRRRRNEQFLLKIRCLGQWQATMAHAATASQIQRERATGMAPRPAARAQCAQEHTYASGMHS